MIVINETRFRDIIRKEYLEFLSESVNVDSAITSLILSLKDVLLRKNFICNAQYIRPDQNKKNGDYGYCKIKVDTTVGRGKTMKPKTIAKYVKNLCNKISLNKFFLIDSGDYGYDGRYCEFGIQLKPKYVEKYMERNNL